MNENKQKDILKDMATSRTSVFINNNCINDITHFYYVDKIEKDRALQENSNEMQDVVYHPGN